MPRIIPAVQYRRPNGERREGEGFLVPAEWSKEDNWKLIQEKLDLLDKHHIEITAELMVGDGMVNVCLDDGEMDYKFELFPNNENLSRKVIDLVLQFDVDDYLKAKEAFNESEGR